MSDNLHPHLKQMIPMVEGIARTIGKHCEVVLHDFSKLPDSIIAISNGHVTGRSVGSPQTEHSFSVIKKKKNSKDDFINYSSKTIDGKPLKSSSFFIRDEDGKAIGVFCINIDLTSISACQMVLEDILSVENFEKQSENLDNTTNTHKHVSDILNKLVEDTLGKALSPVAYLSKEDKVMIVKELDLQGVFLIKGAIDYVAEVLCVSRYTIYNYLDEIRDND